MAQSSSVKIIGGRWRGRPISFVDVPGCRPTANRIRETLFNWLMHTIQGAHCLDCFSGSGALSFEALSRGAASVQMIENNPSAAQAIETTIRTLDCSEQACLIPGSTPLHAALLDGPFDLIFLDPPFDADLWLSTLNWINQEKLLKPGGLLYFEAPVQLNWPETLASPWSIHKLKHTQNLQYGLLRYAPT